MCIFQADAQEKRRKRSFEKNKKFHLLYSVSTIQNKEVFSLEKGTKECFRESRKEAEGRLMKERITKDVRYQE